MATKKKKVSRKAPKKAVSRKKSAPKKKAAKRKTVKQSRPAGPREQKLANNALKLVDQAASILRQGIRTSANTTEKARHEAKQKAHNLLNRASDTLGDILSGGTSTLRNVINRI